MPKRKRKELSGRGAVGKAIVVGTKDRETNRISARSVEGTDGATLKGFVAEHTTPGAKVFTDEASGYKGMDFVDHETVSLHQPAFVMLQGRPKRFCIEQRKITNIVDVDEGFEDGASHVGLLRGSA